MSTESAQDLSTEKIRTITGLIAVIVGILAVVALAIFSTQFLDGNKQSIVAITSSAFGIVSATVTAYLGIKATANAAGTAAKEMGEQQGETTVARHEAGVKESKIGRINEKLTELEADNAINPEAAKALRDVSIKAEEEARIKDPLKGDGGG